MKGRNIMELSFKNLSKEFKDVKAVSNINYSMRKGVYGLLGINGAGKTTLMSMLCTITNPTNGEITFNGKNILKLGEKYREILGYLPQNFGYYPDLKIYDYMMYIASIKGIDSEVASKRIEELLKQVGLYQNKNEKMKNLSGGMVRRVGIAQAMLNNPQILVLDEPTAGLDPSERIRFRNLISELSEDRLVLLSTHIVSDVEFIANGIILMKDGQFIKTGTVEEIISSMDKAVWKIIVDKNKVNYYLKNYLVANIKTMYDSVEIKILSKEPPTNDAIKENATLEDAFLLYFGKKAGDEIDA